MKLRMLIIAPLIATIFTGCMKINISVGSGSGGTGFDPGLRSRVSCAKDMYNQCIPNHPPGCTCS